MNTPHILILAALAISSVGCAALGQHPCKAPDGAPLAVSVTLRDTSVIKGSIAPNTVLEGAVAFKDNVKLPAATIREMAADGTNAARLVTLANGDKFHFTPTTKTLTVTSVLGDLALPLANIQRATFSPASSDSTGLIFHCTFDSSEAVEKPAVGPGGKVLLPDLFSEGKFGNAMRVGPRQESARISIPAGFLKPKGCIEWWAKISSPSDGFSSCDPRFFRIRFTETIVSVFEFSSNDGMGGGGLVVRFPGLHYLQKRGQRTAWRYSQYFGQDGAQDWHHYAIVWNADGLSFPNESSHFQLAVYIDGKRTYVEPFDWRQKINVGILESQSATIDFPFNGEFDNTLIGNACYLIDDMKIWETDTPPAL